MAQIIQQPDGKFMAFDGRCGQIVFWDATEDEVVQWFREQAEADAKRMIEDSVRRTKDNLGHIKAGKPRHAYAQFALTWEEAVERDREFGGEASAWFDAGQRESGG